LYNPQTSNTVALPYDFLSLIILPVADSCYFSYINISQGSIATFNMWWDI